MLGAEQRGAAGLILASNDESPSFPHVKLMYLSCLHSKLSSRTMIGRFER